MKSTKSLRAPAVTGPGGMRPQPANKGWLMMRLPMTARLSACAVAFAALLSACGKGTPLTSGTATPPPPFIPKVTSEYVIPTKGSQPMGIALGADSNLWFTEFHASKIGQLNTSAKFTENVTPTAAAGPNGIASGPNGLLWFTETNVWKIGQITLGVTPTFTDFLLPNPAARPTGIALGSDGDMWVTDPGTSSIWRIDQRGVATFCKITTGAQPLGITNGPDGAIWFTEPGINSVGRLPVSKRCSGLVEFKLPNAGAYPAGITAGTDNALWFTERNAQRLGRIALTGQITDFPLTGSKSPYAILQGIDGNFYFTDTLGNQMGQFKYKNQKVSLFAIPTANSQPTAMTFGPDQQLYFTETAASQLAQFKYF